MTVVTVICCSEDADPNWRWIESLLPVAELKFEFVGPPASGMFRTLGRLNLDRLRTSFNAIRVARLTKAQILVTHGPTLAAWCALIAWASCTRISILAHSFNFPSLPNRMKRLIFKFALSRIEHFVVYSRIEREIYSKGFGIPIERFEFIHWGALPPSVKTGRVVPGSERYVSAIGGNARDYRVLICTAWVLSDIQFVLVVRPESLVGLKIPPNVMVYTNIPFDEAMNVLFHSSFMILPLLSSEVPCGHVTLVAAMHLGKAIVVTDSRGVGDYVVDGENAITVAPGSSDGLVSATKRLWQDERYCDCLGERGRAFAALNCTESQIAEHFLGWARKRLV